MRIQSIIIFAFLLGNGPIIWANESTALKDSQAKTPKKESKEPIKGMFQQLTPKIIYGYTDFNFNSSTGLNYNRFQGHSNLYSIGADNVVLRPSIYAGLYIFKVDTVVNSQMALAPSNPSNSYQTIHNNTIIGHILKSFNNQFYLDFSGAYGQNNVNNQTWINQDTSNPQVGQGKYTNNNWLASVNAIYRKTWKNLDIKFNGGALYSQINTGSYLFTFQPTLPALTVASLTNKVTMLMENVEVGYPVTSQIKPFINGGLIQVVQFSNSRPVLASQINGTLPQLNMNQNGYRLGGGVALNHKKFTLRVEEKYYNSNNTFRSYLTLVGLEYQFG